LDGAVLHLGNAAGSSAGLLSFSGGQQTLDGTAAHPGTVILGGSGSNLLGLSGGATALTLGPHLTVEGTAGTIDTNSGSFDNRGTILADPSVLGTAAGTLTLHGTNWTNHGTIQAQHGASLTLDGASTATTHAWTNSAAGTVNISGTGTLRLQNDGVPAADGSGWLNAGSLSASGGATVSLGGTFTFADLGSFNRTGATVNLTGTLNNAGQTLLLNNTTGSWNFAGGTLSGGALQ